jgi:hypothetical protein
MYYSSSEEYYTSDDDENNIINIIKYLSPIEKTKKLYIYIDDILEINLNEYDIYNENIIINEIYYIRCQFNYLSILINEYKRLLKYCDFSNNVINLGNELLYYIELFMNENIDYIDNWNYLKTIKYINNKLFKTLHYNYIV